jgi:predicted Zn finger-like uncharacterized protein
MLTTCPECQTTFRLSHAQLEARRGLVRCGYCRAVFNAYDTLLPEFQVPETSPGSPAGMESDDVAVEALPAAPPPEFAEAPIREADRADLEVATSEDADKDSDDEAFVLHLSERVDSERLALPGWEVPTIPGPEPALSVAESSDTILLSELPTREQIEPDWRLLKYILYGALSLILVLALCVQSVYFLRVPLVAWMPEIRPDLEAACLKLGCRIPLPSDLAAIRVESSSLETDPEQPNRASLRVSFSNRSRDAQQWPHFVLKLTDWKGGPLAQKAFGPDDYLPKEKAGMPGMMPMSEHEFRLDLDLGRLSASGYEVRPRYP